MENKTRKLWKTLNEDLKKIRNRRPETRIIDEYNKMKRDEEVTEKEKGNPKQREKKIASPVTGAVYRWAK